MDKILLTAFLTALAGFVTAALSIVKLVNEKESKTTEFRQSWTDSARKALADLIAKINSQASVTTDTRRRFNSFEKLGNSKPASEEGRVFKAENAVFIRESWKESLDASRVLMQDIYHSYATVKLHFKPHDEKFAIVENKVEGCILKLKEMRAENDIQKVLVMREQVHAAADEISNAARFLLKSEWETVKLGEPAYRKTQQWSVRVCVVMFFVLFVIGIHFVVSYLKNDRPPEYRPVSEMSQAPIQNDTSARRH
ncbi:hypothetical protein [Pseudomonas coronafaciens]|uniref:hypothetical protein n=1 Tax=Pseudomonas coronafaciens TaxID=53409 RepID=UPI000EFF2093|nr:hypothetical protein [Pseudomonas coronafaciens]RMP29842.1 hypothetical protein ALQ25_102086 [Pseudomonas coronafaciens pv. atropurpurea]